MLHSLKDLGIYTNETLVPTLNCQPAMKTAWEVLFLFDDLSKSCSRKHFAFFMMRWFNFTCSTVLKSAHVILSEMSTMLRNCRDLQHKQLSLSYEERFIPAGGERGSGRRLACMLICKERCVTVSSAKNTIRTVPALLRLSKSIQLGIGETYTLFKNLQLAVIALHTDLLDRNGFIWGKNEFDIVAAYNSVQF